ncbi:uncharacterized protein BXZ73DRAFT_82646 [Epithele typhae]|uniref:uncharacterized protein n=1 Tax=Epithele typhae TaxID=378194 RepID=UPI002007FA2B|nr:uncharacterized protein BXZ73DRAFT_82646 [Epithele typhae]KAH9911726.1 hypothetical protein BXZ73DRAFT_82646 [Epithele typhae]
MKLWHVVAVVLAALSPLVHILVPYIRLWSFHLKHPQNPYTDIVLASANSALVTTLCFVVFRWPQSFCGSLVSLPSPPVAMVDRHTQPVSSLSATLTECWPPHDDLDIATCEADLLKSVGPPWPPSDAWKLKYLNRRACSSLGRSLDNTAFIIISTDHIYEIYLSGLDVMRMLGMPALAGFKSHVRAVLEDDALKYLRIVHDETAIANDVFNEIYVFLTTDCDSTAPTSRFPEVLHSVESIATWLNEYELALRVRLAEEEDERQEK